MTLIRLLFAVLLLTSCAVSDLAPRQQGAVRANLRIESETLLIRFDQDSKGGVNSIVDLASANDLISNKDAASSLFLIDARHDGNALKLTQADATKWKVTLSGKRTKCTVSSSGLGGLNISATATIAIGETPEESVWSLEIENNEPGFTFEEVKFPYLNGVEGLGESPEDDVMAVSELFGKLYQNPYARARKGSWVPTAGSRYPNHYSMQFLALYDEAGGFYSACEDTKMHVKVPILRKEGRDENLRVTWCWSHFRPASESQHFSTNYPIKLRAFKGDWQDAADIYREWAEEQYWCAKKSVEREDYPEWFKQPLPVLDYRNFGRGESGTIPLLDADAAEEDARKFIGETKHPYVLYEPGWEQFGPWVGPEFFPPRSGGEEALERAISRLHEDGNRFMHMFCVSMWAHPHGQETEMYKREGAPARLFMRNGVEYNLDKSLSKLGKTHSMCAATPAWQYRGAITAEQCASRKFDILQLDLFPQNPPKPCYGKGHPHPMGYGTHWGEGWTEFCRLAREAAKTKYPDTVMSAEEMCEIYIPFFETALTREERANEAIYDEKKRQTFTGAAPIFWNVYHDYITAIGDFAEPCALGEPQVSIAISKQFTRAKHIGARIPNADDVVTEEAKKDLEYLMNAVETLHLLGPERSLFARAVKLPRANLISHNMGLNARIYDPERPVDWRTAQPSLGAYKTQNGEYVLLLSNSSSEMKYVEVALPRGYSKDHRQYITHDPLITPEPPPSYPADIDLIEVPGRHSVGVVYPLVGKTKGTS